MTKTSSPVASMTSEQLSEAIKAQARSLTEATAITPSSASPAADQRFSAENPLGMTAEQRHESLKAQAKSLADRY